MSVGQGFFFDQKLFEIERSALLSRRTSANVPNLNLTKSRTDREVGVTVSNNGQNPGRHLTTS